VNEIMYEPLQGEAEYIEVFNRSLQEIEMRGCSIGDRPTASGSVNNYVLSQTCRRLRPNECFVLASDSSLLRRFPATQSLDPRVVVLTGDQSLGLNNDGDCIVLRAPDRTVLDSVAYIPDWHNPGVAGTAGRSLEKIAPALPANDARSWSTSTHPVGGTPGSVNSIYTPAVGVQKRLSVHPNPFSPDGDGYQDFTIIRFELPFEVGLLRLRIFDIRGRLIRVLQSGDPVGPRGELVWDGRDGEKRKARIGIYIILMEVYDQRMEVLTEAKGTVILAGRL
jgi:hypothetical protein